MLVINMTCYLIILFFPAKHQHVGVFFIAGAGLFGA
jgi:D-alanyl-lipoteichoic acid acyltransferase DltB (MBOAT superfamily)